MNELLQFETYFEGYQTRFADRFNEVKFINDWLEIAGWQRGEARYDCLVVELYDIEVENSRTKIEGAFSVLRGIDANAYYRDVTTARAELLDHAKHVLNTIRCDIQQGTLWRGEVRPALNSISKMSADNCYGWRGEFSLIFKQV